MYAAALGRCALRVGLVSDAGTVLEEAEENGVVLLLGVSVQFRTMGSGPGSAAAQVTLSVCKRLLPLLIAFVFLLTLSEVFRWVPRSSCQPCKPLCRPANALFEGLMAVSSVLLYPSDPACLDGDVA